MIDLSLRNPAFAPIVRTAVIGDPDAILLVEFAGPDKAALLADLFQPEEVRQIAADDNEAEDDAHRCLTGDCG